MSDIREFPKKTEIQKAVEKSLSSGVMDRNSLIARSQGEYGYTAEDLKDRSCESLNSRLKSITGIVINEMVAVGALVWDETEKKYHLPIAQEEDSKPTKTQRRRMQRKRAAARKVVEMPKYPDTPIGVLLQEGDDYAEKFKGKKVNETTYRNNLKRIVMKCISEAGGEFFEELSMKVLLAVYGDTVVKNDLTGGSDDNGIDGKIYVKDSLGFEETIFFQSKTKLNNAANVSIKAVREFYGVMNAYGANKGIVISNANFFKDSKAFDAKLQNLKLVDANKLFELMTTYGVGVLQKDGILRIDEGLFLNCR